MAEQTSFDLLGTNIDSAETKVFNATTVYSFQANGPNGEIIFDSSQSSIPGFIADTASLALTASNAPLYLPLVGGTITGNLTVNGTAYLNSVVANTSSYSSGSTIFGDALSDTHQFTGSVSITGSSFTWNNSTLIASNITSSMSVASASQALTASYLEGSITSASYAATASKLSILNEAVSSGTYYPVFAYSPSGTTALAADASTYTYQPSTNILTVTSSLSLGVSASSINSNDSITYDAFSINSINWDVRRLLDTAGNGVLDWAGYTVIDNSGNPSIDWENRILSDSTNKASINWDRRELYDPGETLSLEYELRNLLASDGTTVALDWATPGTIILSGSLIPAGPYTSGTSSYDLGSATAAWRDLYVSNGTINMIDGASTAQIKFRNGKIDFGTTPIETPNVLTTASVSSNTITFTKGDGSTFPIIVNTGSGGGTPGGSTNEIQYNNGTGGFAGATNVEISTAGNLNLIATTDPATPSAGVLTMYSKTISGRTVPKVKGPSGLDYPLQSALWQNAVYMWSTTGATAGLWINTAGAGAGTFASTLPTTSGGTAYTIQKRSRYANVVTTANQPLGQRNTDAIFFRGAASGQGGFFFYARCGFDIWTNGGRFFAGMATANTVITADPSLLNNTVGFCVDAADNGAISFLTRGTSATKQSTGLTISTGKGYDIFIFCKPNDTSISYRIVDLITGTEYSNTATLNLPANTTALTANVLASNAALTPVNSIQLGISKIYIETDY